MEGLLITLRGGFCQELVYGNRPFSRICSSTAEHSLRLSKSPEVQVLLLTKSEIECLGTRIEKFDLEGAIHDGAVLAYQLINTRLADCSRAVR